MSSSAGGCEPRAGNNRVIGDDGGELIGLDEIGDHENIEKDRAVAGVRLQRFRSRNRSNEAPRGSETGRGFWR